MYLNIIEIFTKLWASKYAQYLRTISGAQQGSKHQYLPNKYLYLTNSLHNKHGLYEKTPSQIQIFLLKIHPLFLQLNC